MVHHKGKPIYKRTPLKVIAEYANIVYLTDIYGRISRHSKRNLKNMVRDPNSYFLNFLLRLN
jgi:hypothetical protein